MKIVLVNSAGFGDIIKTVPAIRLFRERYPDSRITYFFWEKYREILSLVDNIDCYRTFNPSELTAGITSDISAEIKYNLTGNYLDELSRISEHDILINFSGDEAGNIISAIIKSRVKHGYTLGDNKCRVMPDRYSALYSSAKAAGSYNRFNRIDLNNILTGCFPVSRVYRPQMRPDKKSAEKIHALFAKEGINLEKSCVGIIFGFCSEKMNWGIQNFALLADMIASKFNQNIVLIGSENEFHLGERIKKVANNKNIFNLAGMLDYKMIISLFKKLHLIISNENEFLSAASIFDVPVIKISQGCSLFRENGPYSSVSYIVAPAIDCFPCSFDFCCPHVNCRRMIKPEYIFQLARSIMTDISTVPEISEKMNHIYLYRGSFLPSNIIDYKPVHKYEIDKDEILSILLLDTWQILLKISQKETDIYKYILKNYRIYFDPDLLEQLMLVRIEVANIINAIKKAGYKALQEYIIKNDQGMPLYLQQFAHFSESLCRAGVLKAGSPADARCNDGLSYIISFLSIFLEKVDKIIDSIKQIIGIEI